jgi:hypothetical protein
MALLASLEANQRIKRLADYFYGINASLQENEKIVEGSRVLNYSSGTK